MDKPIWRQKNMRSLDSVFKVGSIVVIFVLISSSFIIIFNSSTMVRSQGLSEDSPWPCFGQNEGRSGSVDEGADDISLSESWNTELEEITIGSPVITNDGYIIQPAGDTIYSINSRGEINWEHSFDYSVEGTPSIAEDGTIYVGSADRDLTALNPDGTEKWRFSTGARIDSSPVIGEDGDIYFGNNDGVLYRVDADGERVWNTTLRDEEGRMIQSSPALDEDGVIYVASVGLTEVGEFRDGIVHAIYPNGTEKWSYTRGFGIISSPTVGPDGYIYVGGLDGHLFSLDRETGEENWRFGTAGPVVSSPSIDSEGIIYIGSYDDALYAVEPTEGVQRWNFTTDGLIFSSPSIGQDGAIYFGSSDENIYALNPDGSLRWNKTADSEVFTSPAIDEDGSVYISSYHGTVYTFTSDERPFEITNMHIMILIGVIVAVGIFSAYHYSDKKR